MNRREPPKSLPRSFYEIWQALHEADAELTSRHALATRLGVSTHTLQRILVDGDVPAFPSCQNARILRSWTRILTRLARHFGREPREWVERVGIPWDPTTRAAVESVLGTVPGRRRRDAVVATSSRSDPDRSGLTHVVWPDRLTIGIATYGTHPVTPGTGPFLQTLARRLCRSVAPHIQLRFLSVDERELTDELRQPRPAVDLAIGVRDTLPRRGRGLGFIPIPGWRMRLGAIWIGPIGAVESQPAWPEVLGPPAGWPPPTASPAIAGLDTTATPSDSPTPPVFFVVEDGVAHHYLRGQCNVPPERLLVRTVRGSGSLHATLLRDLHRSPERPIILMSDAETCRQAAVNLAQAEGYADAFTMCELDELREEGPSYALALALPSEHLPWEETLRDALRRELLGASGPDTARQYAEFLSARVMSQATSPSAARGVPAGWHLVDFAGASPAFRHSLCNHLLRLVGDRLQDWLAHEGEPLEREAIERRAMELAYQHVRQSIPETWWGTLEGIASSGAPTDSLSLPNHSMPAGQPALTPSGSPHHCHSCSVSLLDPLHRGVSDRYCRFCADDEGRLKPRDEVELLIADWMQGWQNDLPLPEARRRAHLFMQAMPAWNRN